MTNDELLSKAIAFNAGNPATINQYILDDDDIIDNDRHHLTIRFTGAGWAICSGENFCLSKSEHDFIYSPMPSSRTEEFIKDTRFTTVQEAFVFLEEWKPKQRLLAAKDSHMIHWKDQLKKWEDENKDPKRMQKVVF